MEEVIRKYRRKGLLVDANLLVAYLVGSVHPRHLKDCRATTRYFGPEDFPLLSSFLSAFESIVTTPHILTEVSNLVGKLKGPLLNEVRLLFRELVAVATEHFDWSATISAHEDFLRFGLADTAVSLLAPNRYLVLTDDARLADLLGRRHVDVVNFNHVRMSAWQTPG